MSGEVLSWARLLRTATRTDINAVWEDHVRDMNALGFDNLLYAHTRFRTENSLGPLEDALVLSTYPPAYTDGYIGREMFRDAPLVKWAVQNTGIISFSELRRRAEEGEMTPEELRVLEFNASHGVWSGFGVAFPRPSPRTGAGIGLTSSTLSQAEVDALLDREGDRLHLANLVMHLVVAGLPHGGVLTRRQHEVLTCVADGKTNRDTATVLGVSVATVEKHLREGRERLNVETTAQAIAKLSLHNLIVWYGGREPPPDSPAV